MNEGAGVKLLLAGRGEYVKLPHGQFYLFVNRLLLSIGVITAYIPIPNSVFPYEAISIGRHASDPMSTTILQQGIE